MLMRPLVVRRGPGLIGAARTAVVAGTATAVVGSMQHRQAQRAAGQQASAELAAQQAQAELAAQQAVAQQAAPAGGSVPSSGLGGDAISDLERLAELRKEGVLTEQEFEAQKKKILGS
ncbi:MAG: SHOCT domain-containing protein [Sporichthyaceae bacterium]|nr:SHOCT domain-containing protein [Sporichthyaceae bacterium]